MLKLDASLEGSDRLRSIYGRAAYDAEAPFDDHGRVLVTSEAIARITRSA